MSKRWPSRWLWWMGVVWLIWGVGLLAGCGVEGRTCSDSSECGVGFYCRTDGICKAGCRLSIECPKGQVCRTNQCLEVQKDEDQDGFPVPLDCDDTDRLINGAADEICGNDKDDNCNGQIDEEGCVKVDCRPGDTRDCYDGKESTLTFSETRCRKGRQICGSSGVWGDCQGQVLPAPEICDNQDNDCNGKIDDGEGGKVLSRPCYSGPAESRGRGACKDGLEICEKGAWSDCTGEVKPVAEVCDGTDGDCDGTIDNAPGVGDDCRLDRHGVCAFGKKACNAQKEVVCQPVNTPTDEICNNNKDDDCNGLIDDGCPYANVKVDDVRSFPHYVAITDSHAVVALRDTKKLLIVEITTGVPKVLREVDLPDAPHGVQLDASKAYVTTDNGLYEVSLTSGGATSLATLTGSSHAGSLLLDSGRAYTRRAETDSQGLLLHLCKTDIASKQPSCVKLAGTFQKVGVGIALSGVYAIVTSDQGLHFVDTVGLQESPSRHIKIPDGAEDIAIDGKTGLAVVLSPSSQKLHIVDLAQGTITKSVRMTSPYGKDETPGRVVAADGRAYIGHRDSNLISVLDIAQAKIIKQVGLCLAPLGLALSSQPAKGSRTLWVTCPGDNTLWTMATE